MPRQDTSQTFTHKNLEKLVDVFIIIPLSKKV